MFIIKPYTTDMCHTDILSGLDLSSSHPVISIVGAGGKTTVQNCIAAEWKRRNTRGVATTTTHMFYPDCECFLEKFQETVFFDALKKYTIVWMGKDEKTGKISGVSEEDQSEVLKTNVPIVAEADGARRLPVKIPGENEPVLFPGTNTLIGVIGLDGLQRKIKDVAFRSDLLADFLNKSNEDTLTESDYVQLIESEMGLQKNAGEIDRFRVILNKADNPHRIESALKIRDMVSGRAEGCVYITSFKEAERC